MNEIRRIFKNSTWMVGSQLINNLCAFVWTILMARYLGTSDFGIISFAISTANIISIFLDCGVETYVVRVVSRNNDLANKYYEKTVPLKIIMSILIILLTALILYVTGRSYLVINVTLLIVLEFAFLNYNGFVYGIFQAFEKLEYQSIANTINALVMLTFVLLTMFFDWGIYGMATGYVIGMFASLIFITIKLKQHLIPHPKFNFDWEFSKDLLKGAFPFGLMAVFYTIYFNIDMTMLGYLSTDAAVGLYNAAYKIITLLTAFYSVYPHIIFPVMSKLFENSKDLLRLSYEKSIKYLLLIILPICVLVIFYASTLMNIIYGNQYNGTGPIITILIFTMPFLFVNGASTVALNSSNKEIYVSKIYVIAAIVNIILNLILIPNYSYMGAAFATVISEIVICILMFKSTIKTDYAPRLNVVKDVIKLLIATIVMYIVLDYLKINIILGIILGVIIYLIMLFVTRSLDDDDKMVIRNIINK